MTRPRTVLLLASMIEHPEPNIAGILAVDLDEQFAVEPLADRVGVGGGPGLAVAVDRQRDR